VTPPGSGAPEVGRCYPTDSKIGMLQKKQTVARKPRRSYQRSTILHSDCIKITARLLLMSADFVRIHGPTALQGRTFFNLARYWHVQARVLAEGDGFWFWL